MMSKIGNHFLEKGRIDKKTLNSAIEQQKISHESVGDILVSNGFITQAEKIDAFLEIDIDALSNESTLITRCPVKALIETRTMILIEGDKDVYLATANDRFDAEKRLRPYYPDYRFVWSPVDVERLDEYLSKVQAASRQEINRLEWLIREALVKKASDIHIEPRSKSYSVFFRVDGVRALAYEGSLAECGSITSKIKTQCGGSMDPAEKRVPQDGSFSVEHHGRDVDMRVATMPGTNGEKVVIRLLDPANTEVDIKSIGITRLDEWARGVSELHGLCLICGPTGSGKTTTLNATVRDMDRFGKSIYTIEDPVEYDIPYVTQININKAAGMDFAAALKSILRMDPDIVIVGEIRDRETAEFAIKASETGHLVIGTLHTESVGGALERLRDTGVPVEDIKGVLKSVMAQRLVRRICVRCNGDGCDVCEGTGKKGRVLVTECNYFWSADEVVKASQGEITWPTMIDDAVGKYHQGILPQDEVETLGVRAVKALAASMKDPEVSDENL